MHGDKNSRPPTTLGFGPMTPQIRRAEAAGCTVLELKGRKHSEKHKWHSTANVLVSTSALNLEGKLPGAYMVKTSFLTFKRRRTLTAAGLAGLYVRGCLMVT